MNINLIYVFIFYIFVQTLISCDKDITNEPLPCEEDPSFSMEIKSVFLNNCTSCHQTNSSLAGVILEDFESIKLNLDHSMEEISIGTMPPSGKLNDSIISLLNCWVLNGAKDN